VKLAMPLVLTIRIISAKPLRAILAKHRRNIKIKIKNKALYRINIFCLYCVSSLEIITLWLQTNFLQP